ncbi:MAG TPA: hypothetical protein VMF06_09750 [Candidatus Limnocylindria bacterium]|jgi:hypothetical protein|nr:hypothetical protein [Candidatus Limnocylindria bacterium]
MKSPPSNANNDGDAKLRTVLREAHPAPDLPPRFQEGVWRRLEKSENPSREPSWLTWLDSLARRVLRPAYATAGLVVVLFVGTWLGVQEGGRQLQQAEKVRYVRAISPFDRLAP